MVERRRQVEHAVAADPSPGRLETDDAVHARRIADRAAGVGAERGEAEPAADAHARPARRDAGPQLLAPRIARHLELGVVPGHGAFGGRQLAEQDGAGGFEAAHHGGVEGRHEVAAHGGAARGAHAGGEAEVLDPDRHAVERSQIAAGGDLALGLLGGGERAVAGHRVVGVEARLERVDAREHGSGEVDRRQLAGADLRRDVDQCSIVQ